MATRRTSNYRRGVAPRRPVMMAVGGSLMGFVPEWERLADALKRVMSAGLSKIDAQRDLCRAIADQKIKIKYMIGKEEIGGKKTPRGEGIAGHMNWRMDVIPAQLTPHDFDWSKSRPKEPWQVPNNPVLWDLDWIELFSADVTRFLVAGEDRDLQSADTRTETCPKPPHARRKPTFERAQAAIKEIYPDGIPDQATEPNVLLCRKVSEKLDKSNLPHVSNDTILRAAGRRK
jgi:hypothetical protein